MPASRAGFGAFACVLTTFAAGAPSYAQTAAEAEPLVADATAQVAAAAQPVADATAQVAAAAQPVADATAQVAGAAQPVADATAQVAAAAEPVADATGQVAGAAEPVADATADVADAVRPVVDATARVAGSVTGPVGRTAAPAAPAVGAVRDLARPVGGGRSGDRSAGDGSGRLPENLLHHGSGGPPAGSDRGRADGAADLRPASRPESGVAPAHRDPAPTRAESTSQAIGGDALAPGYSDRRAPLLSYVDGHAVDPATAAGTTTSPRAARPNRALPGRQPTPAPSAPPGAAAAGAASAGSPGPVLALTALLLLAAPSLSRFLRTAPEFLRLAPFIVALERPG